MKKSNTAFLKSINILDDLGHAKRFAHYHPTSRSVPLIRSVMEPGATMVIASYGSGKSLAAGIGALCVENRPQSSSVLKKISTQMALIAPETASLIVDRLGEKEQGKAVVLSGYVRNLSEQIGLVLGIEDCKTIKAVVGAIRKSNRYDHVAIIWDEFGRHLEGLIMDARSRDLEAIQDLAELASRPHDTTMSVTLLLHQNILAYAQGLNQTSRSEWRKIEGRFSQMRFVEDSSEIYTLISQIIDDKKSAKTPSQDISIDDVVSRAIVGRWYDDMQDANDVTLLLERAWPLSAVALQVLPRLVARVGQNERSLFSFLDGVDGKSIIGASAIYDVFSEAIRSDIGIGGLHRQWVEVESARNRVDNETEKEALACAFLLQAGGAGERRHVKKSVLIGALVSTGCSIDEAQDTVSNLIQRKLLIHRKLNDEISVWHGADIDVASKLREERERIGANFDLMSFLEDQHRAPFIRPIRHNVSKGVNRYLDGVYAKASQLDKFLSQPFKSDWGRIVYVIANTAEEIAVATKIAKEDWPQTILVVPEQPVSIQEAALEIEGLLSLRQNEDLLLEDPLVVRELDELLAIARRHLAIVLHRLTTDRPTSSVWWHACNKLVINIDRPAGIAVSDILDKWYPLTPMIVNDQIVRTKLSRPMSTARIRMITRLMDHSAKPLLSYGADEGAAEASVYRTVLMRSGLHYEKNGTGAFAEPEDIKDKGLSRVWADIKNYFTEPGAKRLSEITSKLMAPPYGIASGLMPILVMAGYKAFGKAVAIRTDGQFVRDILGFEATRIFLEPENTQIEVYPSTPEVLRYLDDFVYTFMYERPADFDEKIIMANMALEKWLSTIADGAIRSKRMPKEARSMLRSVQHATDSATLIMTTLPELLGPSEKPYDKKLSHVIEALQSCRNSVDALIDGYLREAVEVVEEVLHLEDSKATTVEGVLEWVECFDVPELSKRKDIKITDITILKTVEDTRNGKYSAEGLARIISQMLIQRSMDKWQDDTKDQFRKELREARSRIETAALDVDHPSAKMIPVLESRLKKLQEQMKRIKNSVESE